MTIEKRKEDHIEICLERDVGSYKNWWDDVHLDHSAIPACDLEEVDLETRFLGKKLSAPLVISAMTGGTRKAMSYNKLLARAAEEFGLGLGVGSQRSGIENSQRVRSYEVVREFEVPLVLGNIGAPQLTEGLLKGDGNQMDQARNVLFKSSEMIEADAICIHLNYLQEVVQIEGECHIGGFGRAVKALSKEFKLIAKETGAGISRSSAIKIRDLGFVAMDVGGLSGTSFSAVESFRDRSKAGRARRLGRTLWEWGIPTPVSIMESRIGLPLIATGGLRDGLDVGRALALGADCGGMARALLIAASKGYPSLRGEIGSILDELRAVVFLSGVKKASDMRNTKSALLGDALELWKQRIRD